MATIKDNRSDRVTGSARGINVLKENQRWLRPWLFRIIAMAGIPVAALVTAELLLRVCGVGYNPRFVLGLEHRGCAVYVPNARAVWRYLGRDLARVPYPFCVPAARDPHAVRIVVLGESAAYGDPHPHFGLARMIEAILSLRYPEQRFEVINCAVTGINSHSIRCIARDCRCLKADAWVLYIGNNEVIGPFGPGTVFTAGTLPGWLIRLNLWAKGTRLGQQLEELMNRLRRGPGSTREWAGLMMFSGQKVHPLSHHLDKVRARYRENLRRIIRLGLDAGAVVAVGSVGVNLRHCAPFASEHRPGLTAQQLRAWRDWFEQGLTNQALGMYAAALDAYNRAAAIDDTYAELRFRRAQCALALGDTTLARAEFIAACDCDALRFRCDSHLNAVARETAAEFKSERVVFSDAAGMLASVAPAGIPGSESFYEHVHLTFEGTYHVAGAFVRALEPQLARARRLPGEPPAHWPTIQECMERLGWTDWDRINAYADMLVRISDPPFVWQADHAEQEARMLSVLGPLTADATGQTDLLQQARATVERALERWPDDPVLHARAAMMRQLTGDYSGAAAALGRYLDAVPVSVEAWRQLGTVYLQLNKPGEAQETFVRALTLDPDDVWTLRLQARCYLVQGRTNLAEEALTRAVTLKPVFGPGWLELGLIAEAQGRTNLAVALFQRAATNRVLRAPELVQLARVCDRLGWTEQAVRNYTDAVKLRPAEPQLRIEFGRLLSRLGRDAEALTQFKAAVDLAPDLPTARYMLGYELGRLGRHAEAAEQFRHAVRLMPDLPEAHVNLGVALMNAGRTEEALTVFEAILRRWPENPDARRHAAALRSAAGAETGR